MLQLQEGVLVEALLAVLLAVVHAAAGDVRLAPVAGLVVEAGHGAHTDLSGLLSSLPVRAEGHVSWIFLLSNPG